MLKKKVSVLKKKKERDLQKKMKKYEKNESNQFTSRKAHYDCLLNAVAATHVGEQRSLTKTLSLPASYIKFSSTSVQNGRRTWFLFGCRNFLICYKCRKLHISFWLDNTGRKSRQLCYFNNPVNFSSCLIGPTSRRDCISVTVSTTWLK